MSKKKIATTGLALLLALAGAQLGCSGGGADAATGDSAEPAKDGAGASTAADGKKKDEKKEEAVPVEVAALQRGPIESVLSFSANLEAEKKVKVISQARRLITDLRVEEGDRVRRGQLLLQLQNDEQTSARAKVESQLEKAEREYQRQQRLHEQELISEEQFNNATYELDQLRISLADAERELSYTKVLAPISGTVTARMVSLGDQVQIGQELFEIVDFDSIVARIFVPEKYIHELRTGLPARISAQGARAESTTCAVKRIAPIVDPRSGTVKVTVEVGRRPGMRPGMYVDVDLVTATHADAVLVPKRALIYDNDQVFVYRLGGSDAERRVERVFIEPALTDKFHIEPADGLAAGDRIVVAGQAGLKDGALVSLPGQQEGASTEPATGELERASL